MLTDIHSHILPGVDDGAYDEEASLAMLKMAEASGVGRLVLTPHCNIPGTNGNYAGERLMRRFDSLRRMAAEEGLKLELLPGAEVFCTKETPELIEQRALLSLAGSRYMLFEFDFGEPAYFMSDMLEAAAERGVVPVVAHPERYTAIQREPEIAAGWFFDGFVLQLNKDSILGTLGRASEAAADWLLSSGLAHTVASDAHGVVERTADMGRITAYLAERFSTEYASILLDRNPGRIVRDLPLVRGTAGQED